MGGVPALLMVAILGVTYGWQPDGRNGVEYVIQISPDQLGEIERLGEISSTIDPAIRGHVTRVVVKVGTGPLPRITPDFLHHSEKKPSIPLLGDRVSRGDDAHGVQGDHTPMPIPATIGLADTMPIRSPNGAGKARLMKPQTGAPDHVHDYTFPSLPPNPLLDRTPAAAPNPANQTPAIPAPRAGLTGTTNSSSSSLQFTGAAPQGSMARTRAGGPSTDPIKARDNSWTNPSTPRAFAAATAPGNPSPRPGLSVSGTAPTEHSHGGPAHTATTSAGAPQSGGFPRPSSGFPVPGSPTMPRGSLAAPTSALGTPATGFSGAATRSAQPRAAGVAASNPNGATGLGPNDTLGRIPAGIALPSATKNLESRYSATNTVAGAGANSQALPGHLHGPSAASVSRQSPAVGATANPNPYAYGSTPKAGSYPAGSYPAGSYPAGTWSVDAYGRPVDREGRLLDPAGRPIAAAQPAATSRSQELASHGHSFAGANSVATDGRPLGSPSASMRSPVVDPARRSALVTSNVRPTIDSSAPPNVAALPRVRSKSLAHDVRATGTTLAATNASELTNAPPPSSGRTFASKPFFNFLLLISFVFNVYLIFWLKKLRYEYHDMVAAKRIAASGDATT